MRISYMYNIGHWSDGIRGGVKEEGEWRDECPLYASSKAMSSDWYGRYSTNTHKIHPFLVSKLLTISWEAMKKKKWKRRNFFLKEKKLDMMGEGIAWDGSVE